MRCRVTFFNSLEWGFQNLTLRFLFIYKVINYNYEFVFYDVDERQIQKVFEMCKNIYHTFKNQFFEAK